MHSRVRGVPFGAQLMNASSASGVPASRWPSSETAGRRRPGVEKWMRLSSVFEFARTTARRRGFWRSLAAWPSSWHATRSSPRRRRSQNTPPLSRQRGPIHSIFRTAASQRGNLTSATAAFCTLQALGVIGVNDHFWLLGKITIPDTGTVGALAGHFDSRSRVPQLQLKDSERTPTGARDGLRAAKMPPRRGGKWWTNRRLSCGASSGLSVKATRSSGPARSHRATSDRALGLSARRDIGALDLPVNRPAGLVSKTLQHRSDRVDEPKRSLALSRQSSRRGNAHASESPFWNPPGAAPRPDAQCADEQVGPSELSRSWSIAALGFVERSLIGAL